MCEFFKNLGTSHSARVMSVNTVVDYTLSVEVPQEGSYYVRVKPIGLISLTTREGMSLYDTRASENDLHVNRMDSHSIQMGRVSFEALGINSDNTSCNLQVMLWDSEGNNLLSWMLKEGIAGLVGGSNYWNPETGKRDKKVQCLCPYGRSVTDDGKEYQPFQYSPLEWTLVDSERKVIEGRQGMWAAEPHEKFLPPAISRKKLSGKVQGKNDKFSSTDHKRFKSSCYEENLACRINFKWLGDLLGFKKGHDPSPHIFGSVPPDNEPGVVAWYEEAFSPKCVHLTKRTKEGKSTGEDQDLINVMLLTDYNKEDDLVLVAGDGGCLKPLRRLMERRQRAQWNRAQGSLSRAEDWRRGCPIRGAGGGSRSHLIPVGPLTMQGQRGHTHPTGAIITRRHGDARRGLGREVVVVRDEDAPGVTAVTTEAGGGGGVVAQAITELAGHHVSTPPLGERGGGLQGEGVTTKGEESFMFTITLSKTSQQRTQGEVGGAKVAKDNSEPLSPEESEVPAEEERRGTPPEKPKGNVKKK
ncbi:hypothetical protein EMCRGX_G026802 [Ephydatia muelleri]